jgi:AraC-like DNA-binding protein
MPRWLVEQGWIHNFVAWIVVVQGSCYCHLSFADDVEQRFTQEVQPLLKQYCDHCHSGEDAEAKFLTTQFDQPQALVTYWQSWDEVIRRISEKEMPPASEQQLTDDERNRLLEWSAAFQRMQAEKQRGDPGPISIRRLNAAEWNNVIRDLVGHDIHASRDFPVDPANAAGFDNSAESLTSSPGLLDKYTQSARLVAEHMLLTPDGIRFAPFPVVTDTDRDRYCVQRIVDFYHQQPTDLAAYLAAARRWIVTSKSENSPSMDELAQQASLSPKYLALLLEALQDETVQYGPLKEVQLRWKLLLAPERNSSDVEKSCEDIRRYIVGQRERLTPQVENLRGPGGINGGSQPLVLWKNRQMAQNRRSCRSDGFSADPETSILSLELRDAYPTLSDLEKVKILRDYEKFCSVFPDNFYIAERGRAHIDPKEAAREAKGRLLSAGFHSMMGYFRDDQPLYELILSTDQQQELDRLWDELEFIAQVPVRQYAGHLWFERAEASFLNDSRFDFVRAEDKNAASSEMIRKFATVYIGKLQDMNADAKVIDAVEYYFKDMDRRLRKLEADLKAAEPKQLNSLIDLISPIYRISAGEEDVAAIRDYFRKLRDDDIDHRGATEDVFVSMLLSPRNMFRTDLMATRQEVVSLNSNALASRWSFFLWVSSPDKQLQDHAKQGQLWTSQEIPQQFSRMIHDDRFKGMAKEFVGNWLEFRRFETHQGVDRHQFPEFNDTLRQAMFEEPIEYFVDLVRRNGKLIELVDSKHVLVNKQLAKHYGLEAMYGSDEKEWQCIEVAEESSLGGLIPMGVFLTQNSPGLRTSPVKRGYWVVRKILGEKIPAPPPNVPELPDSEHDLGELTLREVLEKHREHPSCASCHARFDSFGLLLEGFDPIGRPRSIDLAGHQISAAANLPDGSSAEGLGGLKQYIRDKRADDFRRNFCEKLVAFGLGRTLILSDRLLVDDMLAALRKEDDKIQAAFIVLLQSPQFQSKRPPNLQ